MDDYGKVQQAPVDWELVRKYPDVNNSDLAPLLETVRGSRNVDDMVRYLSKKLEDARAWNENNPADEYNRGVVNTIKRLLDELM